MSSVRRNGTFAKHLPYWKIIALVFAKSEMTRFGHVSGLKFQVRLMDWRNQTQKSDMAHWQVSSAECLKTKPNLAGTGLIL